jgi:hypothetical protein
MAIGINWGEVWAANVWAQVWRQTAPAPTEGGEMFLTFAWVWDGWEVT